MARTKKINENMGDLIEALAEFRSREASIRAEYARLAEQKIVESRDNVLDLMFIKHAASGPSEIANTTGLSRSTVIRWRAEFQERAAQLEPDLEFKPLSPEEIAHNDALIEAGDFNEEEIYGVGGRENQGAPVTFSFAKVRSEETNDDMHAITNDGNGETVYVIWGDTFGAGPDADDLKEIDRPEWLTDDVLSQAEQVTGMLIPGAIHR